MKLLIPPPVYMLLCASAMWFIDKQVTAFNWIHEPWNNIGLGLIIVAVLSDFSLLTQFFRYRTTPNPLSPKKASKLVVTGLYRYSRNPMYVGLASMLLGWGLYLGNILTLLFLPLFIIIINKIQIETEEEALEEKFGQDYLNYKQQVRRWL